MDKTSKNNGHDSKRVEPASSETIKDESSPPKSPADPLKAALDMAESLSHHSLEKTREGDLSDDGGIDDSASLKQVIDRASQRMEPELEPSKFPATSPGGGRMPDDLDALDIQAELDPPDVNLETGKLDRVAEGLRFRGGSRWHGSLAADPLWRVITAAYVDKKSGVIVIEDTDVERKFYLDQGDVIVATSTARDDRLVELLYREGRLNEEEYRRAAKTVGSSGRRVGAILVEQGLIASRELFPLVRHHYESIICDSFSWREGIWRYDGEAEVGERILLLAKTPSLIVEGIRTAARPEDIAELAPIHCRPISLPTGICDIEETGLVPEEVDIYKALDGTVSIEQIAAANDIEKRELQKMIAGLAALGLVRPDDTGADSVESPGPFPGGGDSGSVTGDFPDVPSSVSATRSRVSDKIELIKEGSYFELLEVKETASGYEIRKAYRRLKAEFALERFAVSALSDMQPQSEKIFNILEEAYEVLRDPARREAYRQGVKEVV